MLLARTLSLDTDSTSLDDHREILDLLFENRGLRRIPMNESSFVYDDVVFNGSLKVAWSSIGKRFGKLAEGGLLAGEGRVHMVFGVKSFEHPLIDWRNAARSCSI